MFSTTLKWVKRRQAKQKFETAIACFLYTRDAGRIEGKRPALCPGARGTGR
jgi:hypothetical protein